MKSNRDYIADIATYMEYAAQKMQPTFSVVQATAIPSNMHEHMSYIENLLTADERAACDMATD